MSGFEDADHPRWNSGKFKVKEHFSDDSVELGPNTSFDIPKSLNGREAYLNEVVSGYFNTAFADTERAVSDGMYDEEIDTQMLSAHNLRPGVFEFEKENIRRFLTDNEDDILLVLDGGIEAEEISELLYNSRANTYPG